MPPAGKWRRPLDAPCKIGFDPKYLRPGRATRGSSLMRPSSGAAVIALALWLDGTVPVSAELLKVSVPQRGQWDTAVTELGQRAGIFKRQGLDVEVLYTQGGPESHQAVISGSMDLA